MLQPGEVFDSRYRIDRLLGRGGYADVYLGVHLEIDQLVAIKLLHRDDAEPRFVREGRILAALKSQNTVRVIDFGRTSEGQAFLISEYVDGEALSRTIAAGPTDWPTVISVVRQILQSLDEAHRAGIIHRDLKPENVMIASDGTVKVLDFGIARLGAAGGTLTGVGRILGTPRYMAPEALLAADRATPGVDVFAVGLTAYAMLVGEAANLGRTTEDIARITLSKQPFRLPDSIAVPVSLRAWIDRLCTKDPAERPADAGAALAELERVNAELAVASGPTGSTSVQVAAKPRTSVGWYAVAGLGAAVLAIVLVGAVASKHPSPPEPAPPVAEPVVAMTPPAQLESPPEFVPDLSETFEQGRQAFDEERWLDALESFRRIELYPESSEAIILAKGDYRRRAIEEILDLPPGDEARQTLETVVRFFPDDIRARQRLADLTRSEKIVGSIPFRDPAKSAPDKSGTDDKTRSSSSRMIDSARAEELYAEGVKAYASRDFDTAIEKAGVAVVGGCGDKCYRLIGMSHYNLHNPAAACVYLRLAKSVIPADLDC